MSLARQLFAPTRLELALILLFALPCSILRRSRTNSAITEEMADKFAAPSICIRGDKASCFKSWNLAHPQRVLVLKRARRSPCLKAGGRRTAKDICLS